MEEVLASHPDVAECWPLIGVSDQLKDQAPMGLSGLFQRRPNRPHAEIKDRMRKGWYATRIGPVGGLIK